MVGYAAHHRDILSGPIQMAGYAAHHRYAMIATQDPTYFESGSWAVSTTPPMTQMKKSLFASFSSEKEVLIHLILVPQIQLIMRCSSTR